MTSDPIPDPITVSKQIKDTVLRYIDTTYWLRDDDLRAERRALLEADGQLLQDVFLEPVLPYDGTRDALEVCRAVGLTDREPVQRRRCTRDEVARAPGGVIPGRALNGPQ